jgi:hypothetical protein
LSATLECLFSIFAASIQIWYRGNKVPPNMGSVTFALIRLMCWMWQ